MRATQARTAREGSAAARIARDVGAIVALAVERVTLHLEESRQGRIAAPERASDVRWNAIWTAAAVGAAASLPCGPLLGVAGAALEAGALAEIEARATARLLAIASGDESGVLAARWGSDTLRTTFRSGVRKAAILIAERAAGAGVKIVLKELGLALPRLGLRAVLGPAAPVVGAAWSAAWNALEMYRRLTPAVRAVDDARADLRCRAASAARSPAAGPEWTLGATAVA